MPLTRPARPRTRPGIPLVARITLGLASVLALGACGSPAAAGEAERLAEVLALEAGRTLADVGAGDGEWSELLAPWLGEGGHLYATEVEAEKVEEIRERLEGAGISAGFTVIEGGQSATGLPAGCCDAILLRMVYHHFEEPAAMRADLRRALRPGGRLAIVDIVPQQHWRELPGVPDRGGHGIPADELIAEMTASGFTLLERHERWNDDPERYCVVFGKAPGRPGTAGPGGDRD